MIKPSSNNRFIISVGKYFKLRTKLLKNFSKIYSNMERGSELHQSCTLYVIVT